MEYEGSLPYSQVPTTHPLPNQLDPVHTPTSHFLKIHLNVIFPSTPGSSKWSSSLRFPHQNAVYTSPLSHTCHVPRPSHSSGFDHPNKVWWGVQSHWAPHYVVFCSPLLLPTSKAQIFSSAPYSQTPSAYVTFSIWATKFYTHTKQQAKLYFCIS